MSVNLIVETGANVPGANTYISLADALTYFQNLNDTVWVNADPDTQAGALVRAAAGMGYWLTGRWYGRRANAIQSLDWPRIEVRDAEGYCVPKNTVPQRILNAQCQIAKIELTTPFIQIKVDKSNSQQMVRVGPIEVEYKNTAPSIAYWPQIIAILMSYASIGVMPIEVKIGLTRREREQMREDHHGFGMNPFDFPDYFHLIKEPIYNPGYDAGYLC